jgi:hypothetical protein
MIEVPSDAEWMKMKAYGDRTLCGAMILRAICIVRQSLIRAIYFAPFPGPIRFTASALSSESTSNNLRNAAPGR